MGKLVDRLNEEGIFPSVSKGKVSLMKYLDQDCNEEHVLTADEVKELGITKMYLDAHPEGADRGGYVEWAEAGKKKVYFYEPAWEWSEE